VDMIFSPGDVSNMVELGSVSARHWNPFWKAPLPTRLSPCIWRRILPLLIGHRQSTKAVWWAFRI